MSTVDSAFRQYPNKHANAQYYCGMNPPEEPVGSAAFRQTCIEDIKEWNTYKNLDNFFERYLGGEDFDSDKLEEMGYNHWSARNLAAFINTKHVGMYKYALGWE